MRLPRRTIRVRVAAVVGAAMAAVLGVTGLFVYVGLRDQLTGAVDEALETRASAVAKLLVEGAGSTDPLTEGLDDPGETFTQVVAPGERVIEASPGLPAVPLLDAARRERSIEAQTVRLAGVALAEDEADAEEAEREALQEPGSEPFEEAEARVLARVVDIGGQEHWIIVGTTFEDRNDALRELAQVLYVGLPVALLFACAVGYLATVGALRPVERMRRRAEAISATDPGASLPVAPTDDELARLARTLNDMLRRLKEALERERTLVADASHELRTPLAILTTELELALDGDRSREELRATIESAYVEVQHLGRLAEDLLLLARADRGQLVLRTSDLNVRQLLQRVRDRFAVRAEDARREIVLSAPADLAVRGDRVRIEQALGNLVENALRHGAGTIELAASATDGVVELAVRDTGSGSPPAFLPHAFERFSRPDESRSGDGAGLGLAIVAVVAEAHHGSARARNVRDSGAEVLLLLPGDGPAG